MKPFYGHFMSMNTRFDLVLPNHPNSNQIFIEIKEEVDRIENTLSKFSPNSEIFKVNHLAFNQPVTISEELLAFLKSCKLYFDLSEQIFDPTIGSFDNGKFFKGFNDIIIEQNSIRFLKKGLTLDFGGCGKGYALDSVREIIQKHQIPYAFVNFGESSILTLGSHPHGENWSLDFKNPFALEDQNPILTINIQKNSSLSISGNYDNFGNILHNYDINNSIVDETIPFFAIVNAKSAFEAEIISTTILVSQLQMKRVELKKFDYLSGFSIEFDKIRNYQINDL